VNVRCPDCRTWFEGTVNAYATPGSQWYSFHCPNCGRRTYPCGPRGLDWLVNRGAESHVIPRAAELDEGRRVDPWLPGETETLIAQFRGDLKVQS
jgi:hypothetical protein